MGNEENHCPHCGQIIAGEKSAAVNVLKYIIWGGVIGLIIGLVFDYFYFYIGIITDFFTFMPLIHLIAGLLLGMLTGWIIGAAKRIRG